MTSLQRWISHNNGWLKTAIHWFFVVKCCLKTQTCFFFFRAISLGGSWWSLFNAYEIHWPHSPTSHASLAHTTMRRPRFAHPHRGRREQRDRPRWWRRDDTSYGQWPTVGNTAFSIVFVKLFMMVVVVNDVFKYEWNLGSHGLTRSVAQWENIGDISWVCWGDALKP